MVWHIPEKSIPLARPRIVATRQMPVLKRAPRIVATNECVFIANAQEQAPALSVFSADLNTRPEEFFPAERSVRVTSSAPILSPEGVAWAVAGPSSVELAVFDSSGSLCFRHVLPVDAFLDPPVRESSAVGIRLAKDLSAISFDRARAETHIISASGAQICIPGAIVAAAFERLITQTLDGLECWDPRVGDRIWSLQIQDEVFPGIANGALLTRRPRSGGGTLLTRVSIETGRADSVEMDGAATSAFVRPSGLFVSSSDSMSSTFSRFDPDLYLSESHKVDDEKARIVAIDRDSMLWTSGKKLVASVASSLKEARWELEIPSSAITVKSDWGAFMPSIDSPNIACLFNAIFVRAEKSLVLLQAGET